MLALHVVPGSNFLLGNHPVLILMPRFVSALFPQFVGATADFLVQVDRNYILTNFRQSSLDLFEFWLRGLHFGGGGYGFRGRAVGFAAGVRPWGLCFCHVRVLLAIS